MLQSKKLEAEVLAPMARWTTAYSTVQASGYLCSEICARMPKQPLLPGHFACHGPRTARSESLVALHWSVTSADILASGSVMLALWYALCRGGMRAVGLPAALILADLKMQILGCCRGG